MLKNVTGYLGLLFLFISYKGFAQSNQNKEQNQQTMKGSVDQLKKDFQGLKDAFKKKDKKDSTGAAQEVTVVAAASIKPLSDIQFAAGNNHVLLIKEGVLYGWGDNSEGQLGLGNKSIEYGPRQIVPGNDWWQVDAASLHSLGIKKDGSLWAWGWGNNHEMGLGQANSRALVPTRVGNQHDWAHISTAMSNTVAIKQNGTLWVWGSNVSAGLGVGATANSAVYLPTQVGKDSTWTDAIAVQHVILAIKKDGSLWSWGRKGYTDVRGYPATGDVTTAPQQVGTDKDWKKLYVHRYHGDAAAIGEKLDGTLWAWGNNKAGKLGLGDDQARQIPVPLKLKGGWIDFAIARDYAIAIAADGSLWHSGNFLQWTGQKVEDPTGSKQFQKMKFTGKWVGVRFTQQSGIVLLDAKGDMYAYGINGRGEMGSGAKGGSWLPVKVSLPVAVTALPNNQHPAESNASIGSTTQKNDVALNPVAEKIFAKVKSRLNNADKNALTNASNFVLAKSNPKLFTLKDQPIGEEHPFEITAFPIDLNQDGQEEVMLLWGNTYYLGMVGVGSKIFAKNKTGNFESILDTQGFANIMQSKLSGYPDLFVDVPSPQNKYPVYKWGSKGYQLHQTVTGTDALWKSLTNMEKASKAYQDGLR
jgi:alpha-tubulin suppressor-like RCC1 family protein